MPPVKSTTKTTDERPIVHPNIMVCGVEIPSDATVISYQTAVDLLGYEEEPAADKKFGEDYLMIMPGDAKVRCRNNTRNRPLDTAHVAKLAQDILNDHWRLNLETIIVGFHGQVLSGQHRLLALIYAVKLWETEDKWRTNWPDGQPTIRSLVAYGCDESKETTRTLDNVKPRSLADVLFSDGEVFGKIKGSERKSVCKMLEFEIRFLWHRTGAKQDAYAPVRTHSESLDFIERHPRVLRAVKHVFEQESEGSISKIVPTGTAAGLLYCMGSANSDLEKYRETKDESVLDWSLWDKATDFWTHLSEGDEEGFKRVRRAVKYLSSEDGDGGGPTEHKIALIVRAWLLYSAGTPMTDKNLGYVFDSDKRMIENGLTHEDDKDDDGLPLPLGARKLTEKPSVGGIDLGDPDEARKERQDKEREEKKAEKERLKAAEKALKDKSLTPPPAESKADILTRVRKQAPGELLCWPRHLVDVNDGAYDFAGNDALIAAKHLGLDTELRDALQFLRIPRENVEAAMKTLKAKGCVIGVCGPARNAEGKIFADYLGTYDTPGGYINKPEPASPEPAAPVPSTRKAAPKPTVATKPAPAANGKPAAKAKPKGSAKPVLRGGK